MADPTPYRRVHVLYLLALLALCAVLAGVGVRLRPPSLPVAPWWPAAGVAVAAAIWTRPADWPKVAAAVAFGTAIGNLAGGRPPVVAGVLGVANGIEMLVSAGLYLRIGGSRRISRARDIGRLGACSAVGATIAGLISATAVWHWLGGDFWVGLHSFVLAHTSGVLLLAPLTLVVGSSAPARVRLPEVVLQLGVLTGTMLMVFGNLGPGWPGFIPMSLLAWSAVRFGPRVTALEIVYLSTSVTLLTLDGRGPYAATGPTQGEAVFSTGQTQVYLVALVSVMLTLALTVNATHESARVVAARESLFRRSFDESMVAMLLLENGVIGRVNPEASALLGRDPARLMGNRLRDHIRADDRDITGEALEAIYSGTLAQWRHDVWVDDRSGARHRVTMTLSPLLDPATGGIRVAVQMLDVTEQHDVQVRLEGLALHDSLTGLANRLLLEDRLEYWLDIARREHGQLLVLYLDLDDFKAVNDTAGHAAGDQLLIEVSARLTSHLRPQDTVARLGGDEFVVLVPQLPDEAESMAEQVGDRVLGAIAEPVRIDGRVHRVGASIGMALSTPTSTSVSLLHEADLAMYRAKRSGKNRKALFDPVIDTGPAHLSTGMQVDPGHSPQALRAAFEGGLFSLQLEPIVSIATTTPVAAHAQLRWDHPDLGALGVAALPALAETDLAVEVGAWMLSRACRAAAGWAPGEGDDEVHLHVQVFAPQLAADVLSGQVRAALESAGLAATRLVLRIGAAQLERDDPVVQAEIAAVRGLGVAVAMDGVTQMSLRQLARVPVDLLTIDPDSVARLPTDERARAAVAGVLALGRELRLPVVPVGVTTAAEAAELARLGAELAQGRLWGEPMAADEFARIARRSMTG